MYQSIWFKRSEMADSASKKLWIRLKEKLINLAMAVVRTIRVSSFDAFFFAPY